MDGSPTTQLITPAGMDMLMPGNGQHNGEDYHIKKEHLNLPTCGHKRSKVLQ